MTFGTGREVCTVIKKNLRREVSNALVKLGYGRDGRMHLKRLTGDLSWVVDTGPLEKGSDIAPFVGIRHDGLEELLADLLGVPADKTIASVGDNVGFLLGGEYRSWANGQKVEDVLSAIALAQERLLPYLSLKNVAGVWDVTSRTADPAWKYRAVVLSLLLGDSQGVRDRLEEARAHFCKYEDEVCEQFKDFERRVQQQVSAAGGRDS